MKIVIICPYPPGTAPSQRFRFEQYQIVLERLNAKLEVQSFLTSKGLKRLSEKDFALTKLAMVVNGFFRRIVLLFNLGHTDAVFIHREATPVGPPLIEYIIAKILKKRIIYDFDDAIWLTDNTHESSVMRWLRARSKVRRICKWSYKVSCGNGYLAKYASAFNANVLINPTTVDTEIHTPKPKNASGEKITVGWTGSRSTLKYLKTVLPAMQALEERYRNVQFVIIADEDPKLPLERSLFIPWRKQSEITDLARMDIGIMPLPDDAWTRGKCGFKALQYMAMGIPAVVSPVGINKEIVEDGVEGFWCTTQQEWFARLEQLVLDPEIRSRMGKKGREKVVARYSVNSNADNFLSLFQ